MKYECLIPSNVRPWSGGVGRMYRLHWAVQHCFLIIVSDLPDRWIATKSLHLSPLITIFILNKMNSVCYGEMMI